MTSSTTNTNTSSSSHSKSPPTPPPLQVSWKSLCLLFIAWTACKILLIPSYRSTDFDVHRNWLAITRHLPVKEWYYDDVDGTTVHTLDYPPLFAAWEYFLANNSITNYLLKYESLEERCLALLPDTDNTPSPDCVIFHRSTVILSDLVLWWGAWIASSAMTLSFPSQQQQQQLISNTIPVSFLLIVLHPGLLWLDHIHFQYNGMLFGILLASLGYLMRGNHDTAYNHKQQQTFHTNHLKAAVLFVVLLTMKHLFLTLAPFYFVYLLRRYCLVESSNTDDEKSTTSLNLQPLRLLALGMFTATTLLVPFLPFLKQLPQLGIRLFPFGRGLVHDYWAANVWAMYSLVDKIAGMLKLGPLPEVPASTCAGLLLLSLFLPGLYYGAWMAAAQRDNTRLILAVVYTALSSFQLGFHVHEKNILNAIVPLALVATMATTPARKSTNTKVSDGAHETSTMMNLSLDSISFIRVLFLQMTALGLLGIFPLLFRLVELPVKLSSYLGYMAFIYHVLMEKDDRIAPAIPNQSKELLPVAVMVAGTILVLEFIPIHIFGKLEFLPLLLTSVGCAAGLIICWIRLVMVLVQNERR